MRPSRLVISLHEPQALLLAAPGRLGERLDEGVEEGLVDVERRREGEDVA